MLQPRAYWSRRTELLMLGLLGIGIMANIGVRLWRAWTAPDSLDRLVLCIVACMIVGTWALLLRHARDIDKLAGHAEEKVLARLSSSAYGIAFAGYLMLLEALLLMHHH